MHARTLAPCCLILFSLMASELNACGDKLLMLGTGARYSKKNPAARPFSILLFKSDTLSRGVGGADFEAAVKRVGHKVKVVKDLAAINQELKVGKYDYVVAAPADMSALRGPVDSSASRPALVSMGVPAKAKENVYVALLSK